MIFCYIFCCWFLCTWVADGATHFLGTDIGNPVSGSFFPLIAGSDSGSTPSFQSIHESRTDNITLKGAKPRLTQQSSMEYFKIIYFQEGFNSCARVKMFKLKAFSFDFMVLRQKVLHFKEIILLFRCSS